VSAAPATKYGMLYTRQLEIENMVALIKSKGDYNGRLVLSVDSKRDIIWWIKSISNQYRSLKKFNASKIMFNDSSLLGWGAIMNGLDTRGNWAADQLDIHIDILQLLAFFYGLQSFLKDVRDENICLLVDSSTAMAYINNFGGCRSEDLHRVAKNIWQLCEARNIFLHATYINTKDNVVSDRLSRMKEDFSDLMLTKKYFDGICKKFLHPNLDLFATYHTKQCKKHFS